MAKNENMSKAISVTKQLIIMKLTPITVTTLQMKTLL
jgi:hypothetical protein